MDYLIVKMLPLAYYGWVAFKVVAAAYIAIKVAKTVRNIAGNVSLNKKIKNKTFNAARVDENGRTPLMSARTATQTKMMIKEGVNVNAKDKNGKTALMYAAERRDAKSVQLLLNAGANIDDVDSGGNSALMYTAKYGNQKTLEALVNAGANINLVNEEGNTALINLAKSDYYTDTKFNRISYLIENGADWTIKNKEGHTALIGYLIHEELQSKYDSSRALIKLLSRTPQDVNRENVKKTMSLQDKNSKRRLKGIKKESQVMADVVPQNRGDAKHLMQDMVPQNRENAIHLSKQEHGR